MASVVDVQNILPLGYSIPPLISTSKSVLRKSLIQIQANNTGIYNYANNRMQFNIGNNTSFLIGPESYTRVEFYCTPSTPNQPSGAPSTASNGFLTSNTSDPYMSMDNLCSLDVGGIHACFKSIRISAISQGTTIQQADEYNRWNAVMSILTDTDSKIDYESWRFGDSSQSGMVSQKPWKIIPLISGAAGSATVGGKGHFQNMTATTTTPLQQVLPTGTTPAYTLLKFHPGVLAQLDPQPGDILILTITVDSTMGSIISSVKSIVATVLWANTNTAGLSHPSTNDPSDFKSDVLAFSTPLGSIEDGAVATRVAGGTLIKTFSRASARSLVCNGRLHVLEIRPRMSFFDLDFPLFILRNGIMIEYELDTPQRALRFGNICDVNSTARSNANDYWYNMQNCYFYGKFSTPHPSVVSTFVELWNSDRGLSYPIPSYVVRTYTGQTGTNDTIRVNMGVRSLRRVTTVVYDQLVSEGNQKATQFNDAISTFFRSSIYSYQYQVGAFMFPLQKVTCYGVDGGLVTNATLDSTTPAAWTSFIPTSTPTSGANLQPTVGTGANGYFNSVYYQVPNESFEHTLQTYPSNGESRVSLNQMQTYHSFSGVSATGTSAGTGIGVPYMATIVNESGRFFMCADMSRDSGPTGYLTGVDVSIVPLQLTIERYIAYTAGGLTVPRYYIMGEYDCYLTLSSQGIFVLS